MSDLDFYYKLTVRMLNQKLMIMKNTTERRKI